MICGGNKAEIQQTTQSLRLITPAAFSRDKVIDLDGRL